jgi:hypothetical protein
MRTWLKISVMVLGAVLIMGGATQDAKAQYDDVSLQTFYDELSPYGTWIKDPQYGYVWRPDVDQAEFRPYYSNGRWVMTEYGNTWVSNYDWGWAPFHYGRWIYTRYNSWLWVPDTTWGPAWVSWRSGGGYYGWAPMSPGLHVNIQVALPDFCWNFVPYSRIYYNDFPRYYSGRNRVYVQKTVIINNVYVNNNRTYYTGPQAADIRRNSRQEVKVYNIARTTNRSSSGEIDRNQVNIYTPRPNRGVDNISPSPREIVSGDVRTERVNNSFSSGRVSRGTEYSSRDVNSQGVRRETGRVDDSNIRSEAKNGNNTVGNNDAGRTVRTESSRPTRSYESESRGSQPSRGQDGSVSSSSQPERVRREVMSAPPAQRTAPERVERPQRSSQQGIERSSERGSSNAQTEGMQSRSRGGR